MKVINARSFLATALCLLFCAVSFQAARVLAQPIEDEPRELSVPDDVSVLEPSEPTPNAAIESVDPTPEATVASTETAVPSNFGRTVVLVLGGVSWNEWLDLVRPATPGFRKLLEEGALSAVLLPGGGSTPASNAEAISPALLRAAGVLSSGQTPPPHWNLPALAGLTLGTQEEWNSAVPSWESSAPAVAYARRTAQKPPADALLNLGWGALQWSLRSSPENHYGILGEAARSVGARTVALGNADLGREPEQAILLREWALSMADGNGIVAGGDVSSALLLEDISAPYSTRVDPDSLLGALDAALADKRTALIAVEWGDTRRAAMYASLCSPSVAAAHKLDALTGADAWLQKVLPRLNNERDRLLVITVPDLQTARAQWLPCAWWRPQRTGRGAMLRVQSGGAQPGIVPMEGVASLLVSRLPPSSEAGIQRLRTAYLFDESGQPLAASMRIGQLLALQSGVAWLDTARFNAQAAWALLFVLALGMSVVLIGRAPPQTPNTLPLTPNDSSASERAVQQEMAHLKRRRLARLVRGLWMSVMTLPLAFWLVGLCLEVMRRLGAGAALGGENGWNWLAPLALGAVAILMVLVVVSARAWFQKARLNRTRVGLIWLALTVLGVWIGGFALPWNSLLGRSLLDAGGGLPPMTGSIWALWLISATLLGVAGLTRPARPVSSQADTDAAVPTRRIINPRPAALWMLAVAIFLWWCGWNRDLGGALVAIAALGTMWLRIWLERAMPATRASWRRGVLGAVVTFLVLLGMQRGGWVAVQSTLASWWPLWSASWELWWWNLAFAATLIAAIAAATTLRPNLRAYLNTRYSSRLMLTAAAVGSVFAFCLLGPSGPALLALYTLGAVFYEALGEARG